MSAAPEATFELRFKAPYDWPRVLRFFAGRATPGVEVVEGGAYHRVIEWNGESGTLAVRRHPRRHCLVVTVRGPVSRHADALAAHVAIMFDVGANPATISRNCSTSL